jgi:hypothetical protein
LEDTARASEVQAGFRSAAACLEAARQAHQRVIDSRQVLMNIAAQARVESEIVAIIAAAVAAVLDSPYRILSIEPLPVRAASQRLGLEGVRKSSISQNPLNPFTTIPAIRKLRVTVDGVT